jgi:hypothetical protein
VKKFPTERADQVAYQATKAEAQLAADASGREMGIHYSDIAHEWMWVVLPAIEHRRASELTCEVVIPHPLIVRGHGDGI